MPLDPGAPAPGESAYAVVIAFVEDLGGRVLTAAETTEDVAEHPARLPAATAGSGSADLEAAVAGFAEAWGPECTRVAHTTRLLGDGLVSAAHAYRGMEWAAGAAFARLLPLLLRPSSP